jgi:hypothetical protein
MIAPLDLLGEEAGLNIQMGKPLSIAEDFDERDQDRYELDLDSQEDLSNSYDLTLQDDIKIVTTETGQIERIHPQSVELDALDA